MSYQTGWIQEVKRKGWTAFKLRWREKVGVEWQVKTQTLPREINGKETVRKDAQQTLDRILQEVNSRNGVATGTTEVTFEGLLADHWDDYVVRNKLRQSTKDGYTSMLEQWIKPHFGHMLVTKITKETVSAFFKSLRGEKLSDKYQKNIYGLLTKIFEIAVAFDIITFSPVNKTLHRPHVMREEKQTLPIEKVRAFFEALPASWRSVVTVLLLTGMRQGELLGLRWQDIDFVSKKILKRNVVYRGQLVEGLKQTKRTGEVKKHVIGMCPIVETLLTTRRACSLFTTSEDYVFCREDGRPLDPDHIRRYVLYPAMEAAEIPMAAHANGLHMFRHTVVSELAKRGGLKAAQAQAGHANIATTANIYTHVDGEQQDSSALILQEAFAAHLLPTVPSSAVN